MLQTISGGILSMKRLHHVFIAMFIYLFIAYYLPAFEIGYIWIVGCLTLFPDYDILFGLKHRNWFFHSNLLPLIQCIFYQNNIFILALLAVTIHLILDLRFDKVGGTYCIHGLNSLQSTIYYLINIGWGITIIVILIT